MDTPFNFDDDYLARLRARDPAALDHFCQRFYRPVRNVVRHRVRGADADDLVQDVFVAALKRIDAGEPQDSKRLFAYVVKISHNLIFRYWSNRNRWVFDDDEDVCRIADRILNAEAQLIRELEANQVRLTVQRLSARDQEVIERIVFREQDRDAAAREMGVTRENLKLILCRALQRFRREWDIIQQEGL